MPSKQLVKRTYLFPCTGYVASVSKALAPPTAMTADSREWLVSPVQGQLIRRGGTKLVGDLPYNRTGIFEGKWVYVPDSDGYLIAWDVFGLSSPSTTTAYPVVAVLWGDEFNQRFGTITVRSSNSVVGEHENYSLGKEFSCSDNNTLATTYDIDHEEPQYHVTSLAIRSKVGTASSIGRTRGAYEFSRRFFATGSRKVSRLGRNVYLPNLYGTPAAWDGNFNELQNGTRRMRIRPWGRMPPLFPPSEGSTTASSGTDANWEDGDTFYVSCVFKYEDGSYSMPVIPRPVSATLTGGFGLFTIGTAGGASKYRSVAWSNIPIGPDGVVARLLLRTQKVKLASSTDAALATIDISKLFVTAIINNNAQTSYVDPNGSDSALVADERVVRFDHIWPPAARYSFEFDQRTALGYTSPNPSAIVLGPTGTSASRDLNTVDTSATLYGTVAWLFHIQKTAATGAYTFELRRCPSVGGTPTDTAITCDGTTKLQDIVDAINATTAAGNADEWAAQLAPGADNNAVGTDLAPTSVVVAGCSWSLASTTATSAVPASPTITTTTTNGFADVALGMRVSGTNMPNGAFVSRITSTTSIVVTSYGAVSASGGAQALTFFVDTGDDRNATVIQCQTTSGSPILKCRMSAAFGQVHLGMVVTGSGIAASSHVSSSSITGPDSSGDFSITLNNNATVTSSNVAITFTRQGWIDSAGTRPFGNVRAFAASWPEVISFRGGYLDLFPVQKRDVYFTIGGPGNAAHAAESFVLPNRRTVPASAGALMGGAPLPNGGAVLCYSGGIFILKNQRGGTTGEDFDYRVTELNVTRGCISPRSVRAFNGVVGYMTRDGYIVTDGTREVLISQDLYDSGTDTGRFAGTVMNTMLQYAATDDPRDLAAASVTRGALHLAYNNCLERSKYDYSEGVEASGLAAVLKSGAGGVRPFPWSAPISQAGGGVIAEIPTSTTTRISYFTAYASKQGGFYMTPTEGLLLEIDTPISISKFDATKETTVAVNLNGTNVITEFTPGAFHNVPVGAFVGDFGAFFAAGTTVVAKSADGASMTLSAATGTSGPQVMAFYGIEVQPVAYFAMDMVDNLRAKKRLHRLSCLYKNPNGVMQLIVSRDRQRQTAALFSVPTTGVAEQSRAVVEMPQRMRGLGEVVETGVAEDGTASLAQPEFWGIEAEVEVVDSLR